MKRIFREHGGCCVWISITDEGELELSGQDLGGTGGTSEYEYWITVGPDDFHIIRNALGAQPDADIVDLMCSHSRTIFEAGERAWLESLGIAVDFSNRFEFQEDR